VDTENDCILKKVNVSEIGLAPNEKAQEMYVCSTVTKNWMEFLN
jgi:hypothetical protein